MNTKKQKRREPGTDEPLHDPHHPSDNEEHDDDDDNYSDSSSDLGLEDASNVGNSQAMSGGPGDNNDTQNGIKHQPTDLSPNSDPRASTATDRTASTAYTNGSSSTKSTKDTNKQNKRVEERKHRGLMQWKPMRNASSPRTRRRSACRSLRRS
jgi:hypothetical protein